MSNFCAHCTKFSCLHLRTVSSLIFVIPHVQHHHETVKGSRSILQTLTSNNDVASLSGNLVFPFVDVHNVQTIAKRNVSKRATARRQHQNSTSDQTRRATATAHAEWSDGGTWAG